MSGVLATHFSRCPGGEILFEKKVPSRVAHQGFSNQGILNPPHPTKVSGFPTDAAKFGASWNTRSCSLVALFSQCLVFNLCVRFLTSIFPFIDLFKEWK